MAFVFGPISLDIERRELHSGPRLVPIEPKVFDLLQFLICNRDRVVSRDDLVAAVWGGRNVSDAAIAVRINAARRAIGDDGEQQRLIRTVARKGFRFIGDVREANPAADDPWAIAADLFRPIRRFCFVGRRMESISHWHAWDKAYRS